MSSISEKIIIIPFIRKLAPWYSGLRLLHRRSEATRREGKQQEDNTVPKKMFIWKPVKYKFTLS